MNWEKRTLIDLLPQLSDASLAGLEVSGVAQDSREVAAGDLFLARRGLNHLGADFIEAAAARGAVAAVLDASEYDGTRQWPIPVVSIDNLPAQLGWIAARFFGNPSHGMRVVGITGTNGKTSCSHFVAQAMQAVGHRSAVVGTVGNGFIGQLNESSHTTPDAVGLQRLLAELRAEDAEVVVMEVSSHALEQQRVAGVEFDVVLFTNLSRDHLDYHGSLEAYGAAKSLLFTAHNAPAGAIWCDDAFGQQLFSQLNEGPMTLLGAAQTAEADISATQVQLSEQGIHAQLQTPWGDIALNSPLVGGFNLANLMLSCAALGLLSLSAPEIEQGLNAVLPVEGRMQRLGGGPQPMVVVDYAHTPDALQQALSALRGHCQGELICLFGCGGDRDHGKRALMGAVAASLADRLMVTSDNPRSEAPDSIIEMVLEGIPAGTVQQVEADRRAAIIAAVSQARAGDIVLIAGKGHETYQEIQGQRFPFSDLDEARAALEARA